MVEFTILCNAHEQSSDLSDSVSDSKFSVKTLASIHPLVMMMLRMTMIMVFIVTMVMVTMVMMTMGMMIMAIVIMVMVIIVNSHDDHAMTW